jgi:LPXTG-motif cell wall-anchored protein
MFDTGLPDPPTDLGAKTGNFKVSKSPKTGDESNTGLWIAVACVSALAVLAIVYALLRKRKKSKLPPTPPENLPAEKKNKNPKE